MPCAKKAAGESSTGRTGAGRQGVFLTARTPPFTARRYAPLHDAPVLFRECIDTPPTPEGVLAFANAYGLLGSPVSTHILLPPPTRHSAFGETLEQWTTAVSPLKQAVTLWDLVQAGNVEGLAHYILWKENGVVYHSPSEVSDPTLPFNSAPFEWIATQHEPELLARFQPDEVGQLALFHVQRVINTHLTGRVSPRLLWNRERTVLGLHLVPASLIGCLWLQFAQAIAGNKTYHRCEYCGKWFEVFLEASRPTRVYCSDACRFKAYRKRQEDAYQLHTQGVSLKEIATRLGTDTTIAKGWIKKGKEK